jgi:hypothetical protein
VNGREKDKERNGRVLKDRGAGSGVEKVKDRGIE